MRQQLAKINITGRQVSGSEVRGQLMATLNNVTILGIIINSEPTMERQSLSSSTRHCQPPPALSLRLHSSPAALPIVTPFYKQRRKVIG